ncbi:MAG: NUDIX domain-containing protein [Candidatus Babeliaceae bacterium]
MEYLDLVSSHDTVIGSAEKNQIYAKGLQYFRVINGFIINKDTKIWIPRRHPTKQLLPLYLDASVGGHVIAGEDYDQAFKRETYEELRIDTEQVAYKKLCKLNPIEHKTSSFMWIYLLFQNDKPTFNENDFVESYWLSIDEFFARIAQGDQAKSDLPIILKHIKNLL